MVNIAQNKNDIYVQFEHKEGDQGKFVAIDIETGAYEMDRDDYTAT